MLIRINDPKDLEEVKPEEHSVFKGYFYYPDNRKLVVNRNGIVINTTTGKILKPFKHKSGRFHIHFSNSVSVGKTIFSNVKLHRVLARTFIGRPSRHKHTSFGKLEVNHIDAIPTNNLLENLEWCTGKENILHIHAMGLHSKDIPVLAKNVLTNEIIRFTSSKAMADKFRIHRATMYKHLNSVNCKNGYKDDFVFKFDDGSSWPVINFNKTFEIGSNSNVKLLLTNIRTGIKILFDNMKEAASHTGISYISLWRKLNKQNTYESSNFKYCKLF